MCGYSSHRGWLPLTGIAVSLGSTAPWERLYSPPAAIATALQPLGRKPARQAHSKASPDQNGLFCSLSSSRDGSQSVGTCWACLAWPPQRFWQQPACAAPPWAWGMEQRWALQGGCSIPFPQPVLSKQCSITEFFQESNVFLQDLSPFWVFSRVSGGQDVEPCFYSRPRDPTFNRCSSQSPAQQLLSRCTGQ